MEKFSNDLYGILFSWLGNSILMFRATCRENRVRVDCYVPFWEKLAQHCGLCLGFRDGVLDVYSTIKRRAHKFYILDPDDRQTTWSALLVKAIPERGCNRDALWQMLHDRLLRYLGSLGRREKKRFAQHSKHKWKVYRKQLEAKEREKTKKDKANDIEGIQTIAQEIVKIRDMLQLQDIIMTDAFLAYHELPRKPCIRKKRKYEIY